MKARLHKLARPCALAAALLESTALAETPTPPQPHPAAATGAPKAVRPKLPPAPATPVVAKPAGSRAALEEAYRKRPSVAVLLELASLAEKDGLAVVAYDLRRRAAKVPTLPPATRAPLLELLAKGTPPSGELLPSGVRRGLLYLDGRLVGSAPVGAPLLVAPGEHTLNVELGPGQRLTATVKVRAGVLSVLRWVKPGAPAEVWTPPLVHWIFDGKELSAAEQKPIFVAVARGTAAHKLSLFGAYGQLPAVEHPAGCSEQAGCLEDLAQSEQLRFVIALHVEKTASGLRSELRLFDAEIGQFAANQKDSCEGCTVEQLAPRLTTLVTQLLAAGKSRPTGLLEISSEPPGADVLIDGRRLGVTPFRRPAWGGEHDVLVHKTGYLDYQNQVDVDVGRGAALDVTLKKEPPPPAPPPPPPTQPPGRGSKRGAAKAPSPAAKM